MRTRLKAHWAIGFDGRSHVLIPGAEVVFSGDTIEYVGKSFPGTADRTLDFGEAVIGPGFIDLDAMGDVDSTVLTFDNGTETELGRVWTEDYLRQGPREAYSFEDGVAKYRFSLASLIRNGITTAVPITGMTYRAWAESYAEMAAVAGIAGELGLRTYLGPCYMSGVTYQRADGTLDRHFDEARGLAGLEEAIRFVRDFDGAHGGLIRGAFLPDRLETCTPALLARTADALRELEMPLRIHCCQSVYDFETVLALHGTTPFGYLERHGLLQSRTLLPHAIYVSGHPHVSLRGDEDVERLRACGATVIHCPIVFARDGEVLLSFARYKALGINLGLGTDTQPPDLIDNMRQGLSITRIVDGRRDASSVGAFYSAATLGGAKALGRDDLGRLAPGAKADITVFDLSDFYHGPMMDPVKTMLLSGSGRDFTASFIAGRQVMSEGKVIGTDARELKTLAERLFRQLIESHRDRAPGRPDPKDLFNPAFPIVGE